MIKASQLLADYTEWLNAHYKNQEPYIRAANSIMRRQKGSFDLVATLNHSLLEEGLSASTFRLRKVFFEYISEFYPQVRLVEADIKQLYRVGDSELIELYNSNKWLTNRWLGYLMTDLKAGTLYPIEAWSKRHAFYSRMPGLFTDLISFVKWAGENHPQHPEIIGVDLHKLEHELQRLIVSGQLTQTKERVGKIQERQESYKHEVLKCTKDVFELFVLFALGGNIILTANDLLNAQVKDVQNGRVNDKEICPVAMSYYTQFVQNNFLREREPSLGYKTTIRDITRIINKYLESIGAEPNGLNGFRKRLGYNEKAFTQGKKIKGWLNSQQASKN